MTKLQHYLKQINEMNISIDFDETNENERDYEDQIIRIIQNALENNGYKAEVFSTQTEWKKTNHQTKLRIYRK